MDTKTMLAQLKALRTEIDALLTAIPDRLDGFDGLQIKLGNCKYTADGSFTFKLEGVLSGGKSREAQDYEHLRTVEAIPTGKPGDPWYEPSVALPPLGTTVDLGIHGKVKIVGARLKAKFNVTVEKSDGKRTCYKAADIARLWARQAKEKAA
jgi:hypothetical protein